VKSELSKVQKQKKIKSVLNLIQHNNKHKIKTSCIPAATKVTLSDEIVWGMLIKFFQASIDYSKSKIICERNKTYCVAVRLKKIKKPIFGQAQDLKKKERNTLKKKETKKKKKYNLNYMEIPAGTVVSPLIEPRDLSVSSMSGITDSSDTKTWSAAQVHDWIASKDLLCQHADSFLTNGIDGKKLLCLTEEEMQNVLNIRAANHRTTLLSYINSLTNTKKSNRQRNRTEKKKSVRKHSSLAISTASLTLASNRRANSAKRYTISYESGGTPTHSKMSPSIHSKSSYNLEHKSKHDEEKRDESQPTDTKGLTKTLRIIIDSTENATQTIDPDMAVEQKKSVATEPDPQLGKSVEDAECDAKTMDEKKESMDVEVRSSKKWSGFLVKTGFESLYKGIKQKPTKEKRSHKAMGKAIYLITKQQQEIIHFGWIKKKGPKKNHKLHERWLEFYNNGYLFYFHSRPDEHTKPIGCIDVNQTQEMQIEKDHFLCLKTSQRTWVFQCLSHQSLNDWANQFRPFVAKC
ncbi:hypothetical protein RFI_18853, partial [Reticulomyxa filosa]